MGALGSIGKAAGNFFATDEDRPDKSAYGYGAGAGTSAEDQFAQNDTRTRDALERSGQRPRDAGGFARDQESALGSLRAARSRSDYLGTQWDQAIGALGAQAFGTAGPSAAQAELQRARDANIASAQALARSGGDQRLAAYQAGNAAAAAQQDAANAAAALRAREQQAARGDWLAAQQARSNASLGTLATLGDQQRAGAQLGLASRGQDDAAALGWSQEARGWGQQAQGVLGQQQQGSLAYEADRVGEERRRTGAGLNALGTIAGAAAGGLIGGPAGAAAGGSVGSSATKEDDDD